ncbi:protein FAM32A-like isoform X2 [Gossypium hirsutum]|uniref:Protein FAM32A-like isoform X2 n=1 Tax=Gossypium hirsutum TaxID=3635 RepID=A0ABM3BQF0_GOSHI|nr:protein FAM32A-like isoform X2 [Gossypium hirsutum]XP_040969270.1 protein FAM32A-like isoform X2 [Gossypium hirsutum]XP_040969271.1 protein FAM32A-like isoform X2 [Gossypium hirsutum]
MLRLVESRRKRNIRSRFNMMTKLPRTIPLMPLPLPVLDIGETTEVSVDPNEEDINNAEMSSGEKAAPHYDDHLTPAERRYIEQREQLDVHRLAKQANKSHRDRIQDFNQYLANMSEHYDIPKVGPG